MKTFNRLVIRPLAIAVVVAACASFVVSFALLMVLWIVELALMAAGGIHEWLERNDVLDRVIDVFSWPTRRLWRLSDRLFARAKGAA